MTKVLTCSCGAEIRGETVEEVTEKETQHGMEAHPDNLPTPEQMEELKKNIRDE